LLLSTKYRHILSFEESTQFNIFLPLPSSELDSEWEAKQQSGKPRQSASSAKQRSIGPAVVSGLHLALHRLSLLIPSFLKLLLLSNGFIRNSFQPHKTSLGTSSAMNPAPIRYLDLFTKHFYCRDVDGQHANDNLLPFKLDKFSRRRNM
jgi:hypothetical protein